MRGSAAVPISGLDTSPCRSGYVEQFDTLVPELTVREMLLYTAELKCPRSEPLSQKRRRVDQLLSTLALQGCAHTAIGDVLTRGISGGQVCAKRMEISIKTSMSTSVPTHHDACDAVSQARLQSWKFALAL